MDIGISLIVMIATIQKDTGIRRPAILPEPGPELTAGAAVAHNAETINLGDSAITMTM